MKLKFYGTRGSIPVCDAGFQQFGGNTTCFQITFTGYEAYRILLTPELGFAISAGTCAPSATNRKTSSLSRSLIFIGITCRVSPFSPRRIIPGRKSRILALGRDQSIGNLREIFEVPLQTQYFPVQLDQMGAQFEFLKVEDASKHFTGVNDVETKVTAQRHNHPGGAYGFRIERKGKVLVICTDVEHGEQIDPRVVELSRGADLLVHDAQYTAEELRTHRGWGHSSFDQAMQVAEMAGVKQLAMTHHDPEHDDDFLLRMEKLCQGRFRNAVLAREGMEIPI